MTQLTTHMLTPMRMPGAKPAMNRSAMEVLAMEPYTTMVMDGGMTMPTVPPLATTAAAKERG